MINLTISILLLIGSEFFTITAGNTEATDNFVSQSIEQNSNAANSSRSFSICPDGSCSK